MIGYKIAGVAGLAGLAGVEGVTGEDKTQKRVLVTLEIPQYAKTNYKRRYLVDPLRAKYRCSKARVLKIEDTEDSNITFAKATSIFHRKQLTYVVNEEVIENSYDDANEVICGEGIHFFLDREVALYYGLTINKSKDGVYKQWHDNGQLMLRFSYCEGLRDGLYQRYYDNGKLQESCIYKKGKKHGYYQYMWPNGQPMIECYYNEGSKVGQYLEYTKKGFIECESRYATPFTPVTLRRATPPKIETSPKQKTSLLSRLFGCFKI